jgi:N-acetyl-gamma-glutamyl-phosphate reductase
MLRCAVVGASGYSGAEIVALLARHPEARLVALQADGSAGQRFEALHPAFEHLHRGALGHFDPEALAGLDVVFLALPHGEAAAAAARLYGRVGVVIDLSGDLRLSDAQAYMKWYGREHPAPELLGKAVYGLPELFPHDLPGARLVACAGCYATASQLAAAPALRHAAPPAVNLIVSAVSGTTGAGRKAAIETSYSAVGENVRAYRVGRHPHAPEIAAGLQRCTGRDVRVTFVPHLAPLRRGIFATVVLPAAGIQTPELVRLYTQAYSSCAFVRVVDPSQRLPETQEVAGTNFCAIAPFADVEAGSVVVLAVLDNLQKGAAGQAVQVMNHVLGFPEGLGFPLRTASRAQEEGVGDVHVQPVR